MGNFLKHFQWVICACALAYLPGMALAETSELYHQVSVSPDAAAADFYSQNSTRSDSSRIIEWTKLKSKLADESSRFAGKCVQYGEFCLPASWSEHIDKMRNMPFTKKLDYANRLINQYRYASDRKTYGINDYWATPLELATQRQGDCEDHAIAKFAVLLATGVPEENLRLLILQNTRDHYRHAILTVSANDNLFMLDDQKRNVLTPDDVPYYQPIYSLNFDALWLHSQSFAGL